ncbi:hypothetical protein HU200_056005 [Digitaria exilis]|uniref:Uncharacterized protein n=1 Tax=Digitaria exilis TaxID=1010633 RepID=A0A835AJE5_9POAL|nr:hypothetical protein HU200_056005 [Digitaria exilis]
MSATLQMLGDAEELNPEMKNWRDMLRELAYDLEDCIDAFMARVDRGRDEDGRTHFKRFFRRLKKLKMCHEIADEIEQLKKRVIEASERYKRLPALYEDVEKLVGIDGPKQHIIERLSTKIEVSFAKLKVVSIVGCGGLGKTTPANQVYHAIKSQFSCAVFVAVSQKPHMKKILRDIAKGVGITDIVLDEDERQLIDKLRAHLHGRRYFVVIDDVWDAKAWEIINLALLNNNCGSRIIATTRSAVVASCCSSEGGYVYQMKPLSFDESKRSLIHPLGVKYGQAKACRVHDIILDYIKCRAAEENFITSLDVAEHGYTLEHKVRRLCINNCNDDSVTVTSSLNLSHVRSLIMSGHPVQTSLLPLMALRVLDLRNCKGMEDHNLASIEKLFHLKYLRLESYSVTNLPRKIGDLQYLETLDIRGTSIEELPSTVTKLRRLAHIYVDWGTKFPDGVIGQMHSLVQLRQYRVESYEQVKSLKEFSKLTKLRALQIGWNFDLSDCQDGTYRVEDLQSCVGAFLTSLNLHTLYFVDISAGFYPLLLDSRHTAPVAHRTCSLQKLHLRYCAICKAPNWMGSLGNLRVVELYIICMSPNDVEILGAIPSLLFLKLDTIGGTNGRIIVQGNNGFRCLKYFSLVITNCGSVLNFEEGSMSKLEHLKLQLPVHVMECLNGAFDFGIQHLSALSKVKVQIRGKCNNDSNYDPAEDTGDGIVKCVARAIKTAVEALPNRPTISLRTVSSVPCKHFKCVCSLSQL